MKDKIFTGTGVAIVTPFKNDFSIDYDALKGLIDSIIDGNVDFIVLLGSTGEAGCISLNEQDNLISSTIDMINKRVPLVVGCTFNDSKAAVDRAEHLSKLNIDGILSASPYYNKPSQIGIYKHFKAISEHSKHQLIIYNVPGRTCSNILPETAIQLFNDCDNIVAIKEASGNPDQVMKLINAKPNDFIVLSGEDALNIPFISIGVEGTISVVGNAYPSICSKMIQSALNGDFKAASKIHYKLLNITNMLFREGNPSGIKALLSIQNKCNNIVRLPLTSVSETLLNELKSENNLIKD